MAKLIDILQTKQEINVPSSIITKLYNIINIKETFNESNINLNVYTLIGEITLNY